MAVYRTLTEGTVLADVSLTRAGKNNLYRFTLAHEAGHAIWHGMYYRARMRSGKASRSYLSCEKQSVLDRSDRRASVKTHQLLEYQANRSAAALLMPESAVNSLISAFGERRTQDDLSDLVIYIAGACRVSDKAAAYRLRQLGLLNETGRVSKILA